MKVGEALGRREVAKTCLTLRFIGRPLKPQHAVLDRDRSQPVRFPDAFLKEVPAGQVDAVEEQSPGRAPFRCSKRQPRRQAPCYSRCKRSTHHFSPRNSRKHYQALLQLIGD